ncbi:fungal-specific transcription factor domain-containing protein [Aspergillus venezuelensis]
MSDASASASASLSGRRIPDGLRTKRTRLACDRCRRRKIKGYLEQLESEVDQLEMLAKGINSGNSTNEAATPFILSTPGGSASTPGTAAGTFDWSTLGELGADTSHPQLAYDIVSMIRAAAAVENSHPYHSRHPSRLETDAERLPIRIPITPATQPYLDTYFEQIHYALPFLNEGAILNEFRKALSTSGSRPCQSPRLLVVLALGARLSSLTDQVTNYHSVGLYLMAMESLSMSNPAPESLEMVQLLLLLTLYSMFTTSGGSTWHFIGLTLQTCVKLGLHQDSRRLFHDTRGEQKMTAFWSTYILDRCVSVALGRPFGLSDFDITVPPPTSNTSSGLPLLQRLAALTSRLHVADNPLTEFETIQEIQTLGGQFAETSALIKDPSIPDNISTAAHLANHLVIFATGPPYLKLDFSTIDIILQQAHSHVAYVYRASRSSMPIPWLLGYSAFHAFTLSLLANNLKPIAASVPLLSFGHPTAGTTNRCETEMAVSSLRALSQQFSSMGDLADIASQLGGEGSWDASQALSRLKHIPRAATRKLVYSVAVLRNIEEGGDGL